jgi:CBS domain containing-hemolysin-like protein
MISLVGLVLGLVVFGSVLAIAEVSISRMTLVRAAALREEGWRTAEVLERIESDPPRYLNSVYLAVMCVQNGSAILVALLAQHYFGSIGIAAISAAFTIGYFVVVEAMSKTFGILHSDRAALVCAPVVWWLSWLLAWPTRALIWLANALLPGKGLTQGPWFVTHEIRELAQKGHEEGVLEEQAKEMIHSILEFRDTIVREVMVPRPDVVAVEVSSPLHAVQDVIATRGLSRLPVYRGELDRIEGVVHAKDVLQALHTGNPSLTLGRILRPARFTPESKRVAELLREMRQERFHLAMVTDEYGSVSGLVTLEDLLEELVGDIEDEYDREQPRVVPVGDDAFRVDGRTPVDELRGFLDADLPEGEWDTVAGLMLGALGAIPSEGQEVQVGGLRLKAEKVHGRRIAKVLVTRVQESVPPPAA